MNGNCVIWFWIALNKFKLNKKNRFHFQLQASSSGKELDAYANASSVVEETLHGIRTVFAFAGEKIEADRYATLLEPARRAAIRKGLFSSISDSVTRFLFFASSALSFWIGVQWVLNDRDKIDKEYTSASLIIVSNNVILYSEMIENMFYIDWTINQTSQTVT